MPCSQVFDSSRGLGREKLEGVERFLVLHGLVDLVYDLHRDLGSTTQQQQNTRRQSQEAFTRTGRAEWKKKHEKGQPSNNAIEHLYNSRLVDLQQHSTFLVLLLLLLCERSSILCAGSGAIRVFLVSSTWLEICELLGKGSKKVNNVKHSLFPGKKAAKKCGGVLLRTAVVSGTVVAVVVVVYSYKYKVINR